MSLLPGGLQLMRVGAQAPVRAGEQVDIEFWREDGRSSRGVRPVRAAAG